MRVSSLALVVEALMVKSSIVGSDHEDERQERHREDDEAVAAVVA